MPHSPSLTRKRKFCRKRRPYNSHGKLEFSSILSSIGPVQDGLKSFRTVATEQNIRTTTLHRIHKKWVMLNKPSPHFITDLRGHKTILSAHDEQQLAQRIETQIDDERVKQLQLKRSSMLITIFDRNNRIQSCAFIA